VSLRYSLLLELYLPLYPDHFTIFVYYFEVVILGKDIGSSLLIVESAVLVNFKHDLSLWMLFKIIISYVVKVGAFDAFLPGPSEVWVELQQLVNDLDQPWVMAFQLLLDDGRGGFHLTLDFVEVFFARGSLDKGGIKLGQSFSRLHYLLDLVYGAFNGAFGGQGEAVLALEHRLVGGITIFIG